MTAAQRGTALERAATMAGGAYLAAIYVFLYAPMAIMVLFSFNDGTAQTLPLQGFTTRWYERLGSNTGMQDALLFSLTVALIAVALAVAAGTTFALILHRQRPRFGPMLQALVALPFTLPGIVLGISLAIVFRQIGLTSGLVTVVLGHAVFITPIVMFIVLQRVRTLDPSLEFASMDLGANRLRTFWHVTLPEIRVAVIAAALLGFTMSFDEITVTLFLTGLDQTLPTFVWGLLRFGFTPEVNAIFSIIGLGSVALIVGAALMLRSIASRPAADERA